MLIIIGGASGSGKTTFAHELLRKLREDSKWSAQMINMDNYFKERDVLKHPDIDRYRQQTNFDLPSQMHLDQLAADLVTLDQNKPIQQKNFEFSTNLYKKNEHGEYDLTQIDPSDIIIVEGIFAQYFANKFLAENVAYISINIASSDYLNIIKARTVRDTAPPPVGRNLTAAQVKLNEQKFVRAGYFNFTAPNAFGSDLYVVNDHDHKALKKDTFALEIQEVFTMLEKFENDKKNGEMSRNARAPDVKELVKHSYQLVKKQHPLEEKQHPLEEKIQNMKKRAEQIGPFFKASIFEEESGRLGLGPTSQTSNRSR